MSFKAGELRWRFTGDNKDKAGFKILYLCLKPVDDDSGTRQMKWWWVITTSQTTRETVLTKRQAIFLRNSSFSAELQTREEIEADSS